MSLSKPLESESNFRVGQKGKGTGYALGVDPSLIYVTMCSLLGTFSAQNERS